MRREDISHECSQNLYYTHEEVNTLVGLKIIKTLYFAKNQNHVLEDSVRLNKAIYALWEVIINKDQPFICVKIRIALHSQKLKSELCSPSLIDL